MDADALYPHGFHPRHPDTLPDFTTNAWPYTRASAHTPVKYYLADFGLSVRFPPGVPRLVRGVIGAEHSMPELSDQVPYDPFKIDIFVFGNVLRTQIYNVSSFFVPALSYSVRCRNTVGYSCSGL